MAGAGGKGATPRGPALGLEVGPGPSRGRRSASHRETHQVRPLSLTSIGLPQAKPRQEVDQLSRFQASGAAAISALDVKRGRTDSLDWEMEQRSQRSHSPVWKGKGGKGKGSRSMSASLRGKGRRRSSDPKCHPQGIKLEDLDAASWRGRGIVANTSERVGIFVDVGAERNAILGVKARFWRYYRRGDVLEDLTIQLVDLENQRFAVTMEEPEAAIAKNHQPLDRFYEGQTVDWGVVVDLSDHGIFVNVGCSKDCLLQAPMWFRRTMLRGQVLHRLVIKRVDLKRAVLACAWQNSADGFRQATDAEMVGFHILSSANPFRAGPAGEPQRARQESMVAKTDLPSESARQLQHRPGSRSSTPAPPPPPAPLPASRRQASRQSAVSRGRGRSDARSASPAAKPQQCRPSSPSDRLEPATTDEEGRGQSSALRSVGSTASLRREPEGMPESTDLIMVGDFVDGEVIGFTASAVLVDIGTDRPGLLKVPRHLLKEFQTGDCVQGMKAERIFESKCVVILSLEDPELAYDPPAPAPRQQALSPPPGRGGKPSANAVRSLALGPKASRQRQHGPRPATPARTRTVER